MGTRRNHRANQTHADAVTGSAQPRSLSTVRGQGVVGRIAILTCSSI